MSESEIRAGLEIAVRAPAAVDVLRRLADELESELAMDPSLRLTWKTVPLDIYDTLPAGIESSWVFALHADSTSGAERHPNSIQRFMSFRGSADMQTWERGAWRSNVLTAGVEGPIEQRWLSIPANVWHRPVMGDGHWVVVSFHTATAEELIEELAADDGAPDEVVAHVEVYAGRTARRRSRGESLSDR